MSHPVATWEEHDESRAGEDLEETLLFLLLGDCGSLRESLGFQIPHQLPDAAILLKHLI